MILSLANADVVSKIFSTLELLFILFSSDNLGIFLSLASSRVFIQNRPLGGKHTFQSRQKTWIFSRYESGRMEKHKLRARCGMFFFHGTHCEEITALITPFPFGLTTTDSVQHEEEEEVDPVDLIEEDPEDFEDLLSKNSELSRNSGFSMRPY